jgi:hypothetical protein
MRGSLRYAYRFNADRYTGTRIPLRGLVGRLLGNRGLHAHAHRRCHGDRNLLAARR